MPNKKRYASLGSLQTFKENIDDKFATKTSVDILSTNVNKKLDASKYVVDSQLSSTSTNPVQNKVVDAEFEAISTAMNALESEINGKADVSHNHDSDYDSKGSASDVQTNLDTHTGNANIHVTTTNKSNWNTAYTHSQATHARTDATKVEDSTTNGNILINGTETNIYTHPSSGVTAGTYKSVTVNAQGHVTGGTNPTTLAGYGITDAESKGAASSALASAKTYADTAAINAANAVKNDLLNGAGTAYDTLKELGDLIDDNVDAIEALEVVASGKADKTHSHAISDVSGLQSALDGKAASSHGTHVSYSTTTPVMDGTASVGSASTVARSDHKHPTDTSRASKTEFDTHVADTTKHITSTERTNWNAAKTHADSAHAPSNAQANQNAFSNIAVSGQTTVAADTTTDTVTFVGSNVSITTDATNDKVTFSVADGSTSGKGVVQLINSTSSTSTTTAATPSSVKSAYDLANTAKTNAATAQTRADSAYTLAEGKVDSLSDLGITATATELNYVDGVTSNIQTQLNSKQATVTGAATTITGSNLTASMALISNSSGKVAVSDVTSTELGYLDGVTSNIQTQLNGKAKRILLNGQCQLTSYKTSVIALCKAPTDATCGGATNSFSAGTLSFSRSNGLYAPTMAIISMCGSNGAVNKVLTRYIVSSGFSIFKPCTFKYNNVVYGGVEVKTQDAEAKNITFSGETSFDIFGLDIYNSNTSTVLNEEVYNSLSYDNVSITRGWNDAENSFITSKNIGSQSVSYATSAGSASTATKATQDGSGNTITSTYATKTAFDTLDSAYDAHKHSASYTPAGTVSKPTFTGSAVTSGTPSGSTTVYSITAVGSLPSLTTSVTNRCLTFTFGAGSLPTKGSGVSVATGAHTHSVTVAGSVSQPTFTGTQATITTGTPK